MVSAGKVVFSPEEQARMEIRNFVNDGLKDVQAGNLYEFDEACNDMIYNKVDVLKCPLAQPTHRPVRNRRSGHPAESLDVEVVNKVKKVFRVVNLNGWLLFYWGYPVKRK